MAGVPARTGSQRADRASLEGANTRPDPAGSLGRSSCRLWQTTELPALAPQLRLALLSRSLVHASGPKGHYSAPREGFQRHCHLSWGKTPCEIDLHLF